MTHVQRPALIAVLFTLFAVAGCDGTAPSDAGSDAGATASASAVQASGQWLDGSYSNASGRRSYRLYVPSGYDGQQPVPLVVMLHGCTQSGDAFATATGMNAVAEANTFLVAYPTQPSSANSTACWNWFEPSSQRRGSGEPSILAGIAGQVAADYAVADGQTFVAGFSAGAAMAVILGATYPDVFGAIAVHAGLEYQAATDLIGAFTSLSSGGPSPSRQGQRAYQAMPSPEPRVRVLVFHGQSDFTVAPVNGDQVAAQWTQTNDFVDDGQDNDSVDDVADEVETGTSAGGRAWTRSVYADASGATVVEQWKIAGMGHAWAGGSVSGSFTDPNGPPASQETWRFFSSDIAPPPPPGDDTTAPTLTVSPAGGTFAGPVAVSLGLDEPGTIFATTDGSDPAASGTRRSVDTRGTVTLTASADLRVVGVDRAGNASPEQRYAFVVETAPVRETVTLTSVAAEDGAIFGSGSGGLSVLGTSLYAGDVATSTYRGVLSFDTSALPAGAVVESATLRLVYAQAPLGAPWQGQGALVADLRTGCFGSGCALAASDFSAAASLDAAATFSQPASSSPGTALAGTLAGAAREALNRTGRTQFRVRFESLTNGNALVDYLALADGGDWRPSYRPTLTVTYRQP